MLLHGLVGIVAGPIAVVHPEWTALILIPVSVPLTIRLRLARDDLPQFRRLKTSGG
jgi:hypothetical protein